MSTHDKALTAHIRQQISTRRTFAIISHPDAGKTTLTEKLLLYSGMIRTAGMVGSRKSQKAATSDWMAMEQERGISITASAMQFRYKNTTINILDTPGHQDFSEDTYRTLTAADSVIMVIDAAKGVEAQTRKLFAACRLRQIPVITFINKMDLPGRDPLDLMAELEELLQIQTAPLTWPVGFGRDFIGVVDCQTNTIHRYQKTAAGGSQLPIVEHTPLAQAKTTLTPETLAKLTDDLDLLATAGNAFSQNAFLAVKVTPVFFGSALTNFGVEPLFDAFIDLAPAPSARPIDLPDGSEKLISPSDTLFSAYVFKLQANMNPKHHDCVAFMRINSGRYEKDMQVYHHRLGKKIRLSRPHSLLAAERHTLEEAYPGDIIGVISPGNFAIGDTVSSSTGGFAFKPLPQFQPELFAHIRPKDTGKRKALDKGLDQLAAEGAVQILKDWEATGDYPYVAAVGRLQFDVLQHRLENEYGVQINLSPMPFQASAWLKGDVKQFKKPHQAKVVRDQYNRPMVLFTSGWEKDYARRENPGHELLDYSA